MEPQQQPSSDAIAGAGYQYNKAKVMLIELSEGAVCQGSLFGDTNVGASSQGG